jgi:hypothetical protein
MKTRRLTDDFKEEAAKGKAKFAHPANANRILTEDTTVFRPDGNVAAVFLRNVIPASLHLRAYELLKPVNGLVSNRAAAMGTSSLARSVNKDGVPSPQRGVNENVLSVSPARQALLGWDRPDHQTKFTREHPEMIDGNRAFIELVDSLYAKYLPEFYAKQLAVVEKAPWRLLRTVFTTLYVAKNFQTAYHRDGNLKGAMTAITPLGNFSGGDLVLLRWRIRIPYKPGDFLLFDAEELHGNLPFEGERLSVAFYCSRHIADFSRRTGSRNSQRRERRTRRGFPSEE